MSGGVFDGEATGDAIDHALIREHARGHLSQLVLDQSELPDTLAERPPLARVARSRLLRATPVSWVVTRMRWLRADSASPRAAPA